MRKLTYSQAIKECLKQLMEDDERVVLFGQGLDSPWSFGDTTLGLIDLFGKRRVYDLPISEAGITGIAAGAAMTGLRPIMMHPRVDFMYLAMDQIVNHASNWHYMFGGRVNVPVVVRGVINRGNEQGPQHGQAPYAMYAHVPGLKVVMPSTAADAKGLLVAALRDPNPVIYIDDRWLYKEEGDVPEELYETPIGKGTILRQGSDLTLVAVSHTTLLALEAAEILAQENVSVEVIDLRTIKPLDTDLITSSVFKTGHLLVADSGWRSYGVSAEIIASVVEAIGLCLKAPPVRATSPDTPVPSSTTLEKEFFLDAQKIVTAARKALG